MKKLILPIIGLLTALALQAASYAKEVTVKADDTMRFDTTEIKVAAGEELTITLDNQGKLPKAAMGHNLVILEQGASVQDFATAAATAATNEYIPADGPQAEVVVGHTKLLGPSEQDTFTVTLDEPGSYPFLCSFPGHWALMKGFVIVE